ncbi:MAG: hypothetical protein M3524_10525, partial [Actinomycetota bacterium]|nr:hypothetical protein [Actinomycetota bacterium]
MTDPLRDDPATRSEINEHRRWRPLIVRLAARFLREGECGRAHGVRNVREVVTLVVEPVPDLLGSQAGEEQVGAQFGVRGAGLV